ncbi:hypothetical protein ABK040_010343 [Willaertia magna]
MSSNLLEETYSSDDEVFDQEKHNSAIDKLISEAQDSDDEIKPNNNHNNNKHENTWKNRKYEPYRGINILKAIVSHNCFKCGMFFFFVFILQLALFLILWFAIA